MTIQASDRPSDLALPAAFGSGLLMGGADAIPGVSGGTIALVLGIYERFIDALGTLVRLPWGLRTPQGRRNLSRALRILVPLACGAALAYLAATGLLVGRSDEKGLLQEAGTAPLCYGFFFGLVLASLREPWRRIADRGPGVLAGVVLGAAAAFTFAGLPYVRAEPETWMLLYGGALAISVMLLPGISGSLLLLMLNQYQAVVEAIHDVDVGRILVFAGGLALGIIGFIPLLRRLLHRAHDPTMAVLTGLMAGSLRALWPWKENYVPREGPLANGGPGDHIPEVVLLAALGAVLVLAAGRLERRARREAVER